MNDRIKEYVNLLCCEYWIQDRKNSLIPNNSATSINISLRDCYLKHMDELIHFTKTSDEFEQVRNYYLNNTIKSNHENQ